LGRNVSLNDEACPRSRYRPIFKADHGSIASPRAGPRYQLVVLLLNYYLKSGETRNIEEFVDTVQKGLSAEVGEEVMTIAQQFIEKGKREGIIEGMSEGMMEGISEGMAKGKAEGELAARKKLAQEAFAENLPLATIQKLTRLTLEELKALEASTQH
jgi:predicted transposase YdaD